MIFVNSMSDLFHEDVPDDYTPVAAVMTGQLAHLSGAQKRSEPAEMLKTKLQAVSRLPNIWWGVSVENRQHGLPRIDHLRSAPACTRFLSVEPLLEDLGTIDLTGIHWVIVGGESGHGARPIQKEWILSLRDQCRAAGVPFFFKQWGGVRKKAAGRAADARLRRTAAVHGGGAN